jgi:hypothetical protein
MIARLLPRPWLAVPRAYEDWYFVDDFTALGALNDGAISGPRQRPHDAVAALPAGGVASLYGLVRDRVNRPRYVAFRSKPAGSTFPSYIAALPQSTEVWQRKMVLGPSPEFCILSSAPLEDSLSIDEIEMPLPDPGLVRSDASVPGAIVHGFPGQEPSRVFKDALCKGDK